MKVKENKQIVKLGKEIAKKNTWKISIPNKKKKTKKRNIKKK